MVVAAEIGEPKPDDSKNGYIHKHAALLQKLIVDPLLISTNIPFSHLILRKDMRKLLRKLALALRKMYTTLTQLFLY